MRLLAPLSLVLAACSPSSGPGVGGTTACRGDGRADTYVAGLERAAGPTKLRIVDARPAPPLKGQNTWVLEVLDATGKPVDGAAVAVTPFMPDHGHGSAVTPEVRAIGGGRYEVTKLYLAMAGLWEMTVTVTPPGGEPQKAAYTFCLDG
jgi:hypothetical protein